MVFISAESPSHFFSPANPPFSSVSPFSFVLRQDESLGGGTNGWIKQLRVLRAFRLFRLFSKLGQLKRIVTAVALSIVPTLQALVS